MPCWGFFGHFLSDVTYLNSLTVAAEDYPDSCPNFSSISPETEKNLQTDPSWKFQIESRFAIGCHFKL